MRSFLFPELWAIVCFIASVIIPIVWFAEVPEHTIAISRHYGIPDAAAPFALGVAWVFVLIVPIALWGKFVW